MYQVNLNDEDVKFINTAASILMPYYQAQQFMTSFNSQVESSKKVQASAAKVKLDEQIAEAVKASKSDGVTGG